MRERRAPKWRAPAAVYHEIGGASGSEWVGFAVVCRPRRLRSSRFPSDSGYAAIALLFCAFLATVGLDATSLASGSPFSIVHIASLLMLRPTIVRSPESPTARRSPIDVTIELGSIVNAAVILEVGRWSDGMAVSFI